MAQQSYCPACKRNVISLPSQTCNHVLHAIISIFLCGLWIPVWIILAVVAGEGSMICSRCGEECEVAREISDRPRRRRRPADASRTIRTGKKTGEQGAKLTDATIEKLNLRGRERALIYKTLVLTGLRADELRTLTVSRVRLDSPPRIELEAKNEKNREGNTLPLRADLADDLRAWIVDTTRTPTDLLFRVSTQISKVFALDLKAAGIPQRDERGRVLDVHALRTTFGTMLSATGASPRTAQAAMRHSDISLTMGVYTDPVALNVAQSLEGLPSLTLPLTQTTGQQEGREGNAGHDEKSDKK